MWILILPWLVHAAVSKICLFLSYGWNRQNAKTVLTCAQDQSVSIHSVMTWGQPSSCQPTKWNLDYAYASPSNVWELFAYARWSWSWLTIAHCHPQNSCGEQLRFDYDRDNPQRQRKDKLGDRESWTGRERGRYVCYGRVSSGLRVGGD